MRKVLAAAAAAFLMALPSCGSGNSNDNTAAMDDAAGYDLPHYDIAFSDSSTVKKADRRVVVISASPRRGGNTDLLCDAFMKGATEAGCKVEKIFLADYNIGFFGEMHEQHPDTVVDGDDAPAIIAKMEAADIIVLSSPVYYMNIDGQLKTLMDRCYRHKGLANKEFYYITACADAEESTAETAIFAFRGFVVCLPDPVERGSVKAVGLGRKGAVEGTQYIDEAYRLGKTI